MTLPGRRLWSDAAAKAHAPARRTAFLSAVLLVLAGCGEREEADRGSPATDSAGDTPASTQPDHAHQYGVDPSDPSARDPRPYSPKHIELLDIARRNRASYEPYFGELRLRELQDADTLGMDIETRAEHEFALGWEYYKFGQLNDAVEHFRLSSSYVPLTRTTYYLGLARLQTGVRDNCIAMHNPESCVLPLAGGGIHRSKGGARSALATFLETLETCPRRAWARVRWLTNIAAMAVGTYPDAVPAAALVPSAAFESDYDVGRFVDVALDRGLGRMNLAGGAAMEDFDGDGFLDIITSTSDLNGQLLYFKNNGDGTFTDRTDEAGILGQIGGLNLIHADYDDDGDQDVLVLRGGWLGTFGRMPNSLLRNRGNGTFVDVTRAAGIGDVAYPTQTAGFADYDLDGDLDLYLGVETLPPAAKMTYPCQLFRNDGGSHFVDVAQAAGVENEKLSKGIAWGDYDGDRYPDLYVSNQFDVNRLYHNNGDGTFTDVAPELGLDQPVLSFPVWFWDYDNDGGLDLFVAGYGGDLGSFVKSFLRPSPKFGLSALYRNEGGTFRDMAKDAGLTLQTLTMGANYGDLDNDGYLDFYLGTGTPEFDMLIPNTMYRNDGRGGFQNVTTSGGFGNIRKGHGIAFGDIDNDGDQDIFLQSGGIYPYDGFFNSLFVNPGHDNRWITLSLVGVRSNRDAIGARIRVRIEEDGAEREIYRWVGPSGSFGSSSIQQEIGLGKATRITLVEIYWPASDTTQTFHDLEMNSFYEITEFEGTPARKTRPQFSFFAG